MTVNFYDVSGEGTNTAAYWRKRAEAAWEQADESAMTILRVAAERDAALKVVSAVASWYPAHKRARDCHAEGLFCPQTRAIIEAFEEWKAAQ